MRVVSLASGCRLLRNDVLLQDPPTRAPELQPPCKSCCPRKCCAPQPPPPPCPDPSGPVDYQVKMIRQACSLHGPTGLRDLGRMFCLYDDVSLYRYTYWVAKAAVANAVITSYDCDATRDSSAARLPTQRTEVAQWSCLVSCVL